MYSNVVRNEGQVSGVKPVEAEEPVPKPHTSGWSTGHPQRDRGDRLAIAARTGVDGVTMRLLAEELGVSSATAYYHVKDKAQLLELMVEALLAGVACPPRGIPWEDRLARLVSDIRRAVSPYPGLLTMVPRAGSGIEVQRLSDCTTEILRDGGVADERLHATLLAVTTYMWGQLLIDVLGHPPLPPKHRRQPVAEDRDSTFQPGPEFEVLLDGIRHQALSGD